LKQLENYILTNLTGFKNLLGLNNKLCLQKE